MQISGVYLHAHAGFSSLPGGSRGSRTPLLRRLLKQTPQHDAGFPRPLCVGRRTDAAFAASCGVNK